MRYSRLLVPCALLVILTVSAMSGSAQTCAMPQIPPVSRQANIFSAEQAQILGEVVTQYVANTYQLVNDPKVNQYLQEIADRMSAISGAPKVRVELFDMPGVNAFTFPGGRILVSRKAVAFARTEDELAGILAHEFGHVLTHDIERDLSEDFRKVLNVTSVSDRRDIEDKFNRFLENAGRKKLERGKESDREQEIADRLAVWLMSRAGYSPQAYPDVWDRMNELKSDTGNWVADLFGRTNPDAKRLRIMTKAVADLPRSCVAARATTEAQFKDWQRMVTEAARFSLPKTTTVRNVVSTRKLEPPLRTEINHLRFSPDGKWILSQDDGNIYVFTREPFAFKFRIDAEDAHPAQFSPDSTAIVFFDDNYRIERWNLSSEKREWVRELVVTRTCIDMTLTSDGAYLACPTFPVNDSIGMDVRIIETATGKVVFEKKKFIVEDFAMYTAAAVSGLDRNVHLLAVAFSPSGRYFVAARFTYYVAVDLKTMTAVELPSAIRERIGQSFAFMGDDRIVGVHYWTPSKSAVLTFPQGDIVANLKLESARHALDGLTHGTNFFVMRPILDYPLGLYSVSENKVVMASKRTAFDMYDDVYVSERKTGELALYKRPGGSAPLAVATAPIAPLGVLHAATITPDFRLLAASQRSRGALWDLATGENKPFMHGFEGIYFDADKNAWLDFPEEDKVQRTIMRLPAGKQSPEPVVGVDERSPYKKRAPEDEPKPRAVSATVKGISFVSYGPYLVGWRGGDSSREIVVFEAMTGKELWSRHFKTEAPYYFIGSSHHNTLALRWSMDQLAARRIVDDNAALKAQFRGMKNKQFVALIEVLDLAHGKTIGTALVDLGKLSFHFTSIEVAGDNLIFSDSENRTVVYSMAAGKEVAHAFGAPITVSDDGSMTMVENAPGQVTLYSLPNMEKRDELAFASSVAFARFSPDAKKLFVLTRDHTTYTIDLTVSAATSTSAEAAK